MNWLAAGAAAVLLPVLLVAAVPPHTSVLVVDVTRDDGPRIVAPVPLALARAGLWFAPREARQIDVPQLDMHMPDVQRIIDAVRDAPDGALVEIEGPGEHVVVSKRGDAVHVSASDSDRSRVELTLPFEALEALPRAYDAESGILRTAGLVSALRAAPRGPLLHLVDGRTEVRIRAW